MTFTLPTMSIIVPIHDMENGDFFLSRLINSLTIQTFRDFEVVITKQGLMAENTNAGIKKAKGALIKILYMDDMLAHENALKDIVDAFQMYEGEWLITAAQNNLHPRYTDDIEKGNNKLGSPSALTMLADSALLFDEKMSWLLDCDLYKRLHEAYGLPIILDREPGVILGIHEGQMTNILTNEEKLAEYNYMEKKYAK